MVQGLNVYVTLPIVTGAHIAAPRVGVGIEAGVQVYPAGQVGVTVCAKACWAGTTEIKAGANTKRETAPAMILFFI
jgi:hypothetical protein